MVTLRCNGVSDILLQGFGGQNILAGIIFEKKDDLILTTMLAKSGLKGKISSRAVEVAKLEPYLSRETD